jgi:hypothetical protein
VPSARIDIRAADDGELSGCSQGQGKTFSSRVHLDIKAPGLTLPWVPRLSATHFSRTGDFANGPPHRESRPHLVRHLAFHVVAGARLGKLGADEKLSLARADRQTGFAAPGLGDELSFRVDDRDP